MHFTRHVEFACHHPPRRYPPSSPAASISQFATPRIYIPCSSPAASRTQFITRHVDIPVITRRIDI
jgi:hypothetical protein